MALLTPKITYPEQKHWLPMGKVSMRIKMVLMNQEMTMTVEAGSRCLTQKTNLMMTKNPMTTTMRKVARERLTVTKVIIATSKKRTEVRSTMMKKVEAMVLKMKWIVTMTMMTRVKKNRTAVP